MSTANFRHFVQFGYCTSQFHFVSFQFWNQLMHLDNLGIHPLSAMWQKHITEVVKYRLRTDHVREYLNEFPHTSK